LVGKTARITDLDRKRFEAIRSIGCVCCLAKGFPDAAVTVEHITDRGRRYPDEHQHTIGLCEWHHLGICLPGADPLKMSGSMGPSLAWGRTPFEATFGDEYDVLLRFQNWLIEVYQDEPWPCLAMPRRKVTKARRRWQQMHGDWWRSTLARNGRQ